ncbi:MAG: hypothetical protein QXU98_06985 [Candidatus Parvarchaeota archaeon]
MISDCVNNQKLKADFDFSKSNKVYYAHSMQFYDTLTEQLDIKFLNGLKRSEIIKWIKFRHIYDPLH